MGAEGIIAIIAAIGGVSGIIAIIKAITEPFSGKNDAKVEELIKNAVNSSDIAGMRNDIQDIKTKLEKNDESTLCLLRHSITQIYEQYKEEKAIPSHMKENVCSLYENYHNLGGNSYISSIVKEMMDWETK